MNNTNISTQSPQLIKKFQPPKKPLPTPTTPRKLINSPITERKENNESPINNNTINQIVKNKNSPINSPLNSPNLNNKVVIKDNPGSPQKVVKIKMYKKHGSLKKPIKYVSSMQNNNSQEDEDNGSSDESINNNGIDQNNITSNKNGGTYNNNNNNNNISTSPLNPPKKTGNGNISFRKSIGSNNNTPITLRKNTVTLERNSSRPSANTSPNMLDKDLNLNNININFNKKKESSDQIQHLKDNYYSFIVNCYQTRILDIYSNIVKDKDDIGTHIALALCDYQNTIEISSTNKNLNYKKGDIIQILEQRENEWWQGKSEKSYGLFNYTTFSLLDHTYKPKSYSSLLCMITAIDFEILSSIVYSGSNIRFQNENSNREKLVFYIWKLFYRRDETINLFRVLLAFELDKNTDPYTNTFKSTLFEIFIFEHCKECWMGFFSPIIQSLLFKVSNLSKNFKSLLNKNEFINENINEINKIIIDFFSELIQNIDNYRSISIFLNQISIVFPKESKFQFLRTLFFSTLVTEFINYPENMRNLVDMEISPQTRVILNFIAKYLHNVATEQPLDIPDNQESMVNTITSSMKEFLEKNIDKNTEIKHLPTVFRSTPVYNEETSLLNDLHFLLSISRNKISSYLEDFSDSQPKITLFNDIMHRLGPPLQVSNPFRLESEEDSLKKRPSSETSKESAQRIKSQVNICEKSTNNKFMNLSSCQFVVDQLSILSIFSHLVTLDLSHNSLTSIGDELLVLKNLLYLDVSHNIITALSVPVFQEMKLKTLKINHNPLRYPFGFLNYFMDPLYFIRNFSLFSSFSDILACKVDEKKMTSVKDQVLKSTKDVFLNELFKQFSIYHFNCAVFDPRSMKEKKNIDKKNKQPKPAKIFSDLADPFPFYFLDFGVAKSEKLQLKKKYFHTVHFTNVLKDKVKLSWDLPKNESFLLEVDNSSFQRSKGKKASFTFSIEFFCTSKASLLFFLKLEEFNILFPVFFDLETEISLTLDKKEVMIKTNEKIGSGAQSVVFKGTWRGKDVAIKKIYAQGDSYAEKELRLLSLIRHSKILLYYGSFVDDDMIHLVFELMPHGNLETLLRREDVELPWKMRYKFIYDISKAILFLHSMNPPIIHRDLKSANLLVNTLEEDSKCNLKLCDFGIAREFSFSMTGALGSPIYMAPEVYRKENYTESADIYSFGQIIGEIASRNEPYQGLSFFQTVEAIKSGVLSEIPSDTPTPIVDLRLLCLNSNFDKRPSAVDIVQYIKKFLV